MARKASKSKRRSRQKVERAGTVLGASAELVRSAAVILDNEMALGMTAAKAVQQRVANERRVEASDFKEAMMRFQADAREVVNSLNGQLNGAKLTSNVELAKRFITRANDMLDLAVGVATTSAEIANEFMQQNTRISDAKPARKRRSRR